MQSAPTHEPSRENLTKRSFALTPAELSSFQRDGYIGPFPLIEPRLCGPLAEVLVAKVRSQPALKMRSRRRRLGAAVHALARRLFGSPVVGTGPAGAPRYWYKSAHLLIPEAEELALRSPIVDRMVSILGQDLLLWGAQLVAKESGENHRWHEDVEHVAWVGATAWLGLANVNRESTMKVIPGSHLFGITPQEFAARSGGDLARDGDALRLARRIAPAARIVELDLRPGEFFIFSGRAWHASKNSSGRRRIAMIMQFSPSSSRVRVPCSYELPTQWHPAQPLVMLAAGRDPHGVNHVRDRSPRASIDSGGGA
jgi:ectoine hydroxylase-related dioxygenase (phytanoyl-CoA dioxygenase family)